MSDRTERAVAIVGLGAILPDAPSAGAFRDNVWHQRYSITEVPSDRWSQADYYDPDPAAPDKTYSKIGAWVRGFEFDWKRFHVPPRVTASMDQSQQWAVTIAAEALADYGYPERKLDLERTGVILGTAMGGELCYLTTLRICFPEFSRALESVGEFRELPPPVRQAILSRWQQTVGRNMPPITEDTMPGELANIVAGRVANVLNLRGPNFITDAACASSLAALDAAAALLVDGHCDAVLAGGVDRNMGINSFVKFCKIGALSATGTRPFADGADGFVMGEGSATFLLKRLADAERDGDRVYAVVRGVGGSSDGKGKGITAPNPIGQQLASRRAWEDAGLDPASAGLIEAHGTSTKVGDVVEVESLASVFGGARRGSIALGSAKSNVGHLKAAAGAAGLLKTVYALHEKVLPPTLNAEPPNPAIDFSRTPFLLNHELREWPRTNGPRRAAVSAYGFGGTNFHVVLEEHLPGVLTKQSRPAQVAVPVELGQRPGSAAKLPLRGLAFLGAGTLAALTQKVDHLLARAKEGFLPPITTPAPADLAEPERLALDFGDGAELVERLQKARKALTADAATSWRALQPQGIFRGSGRQPGKIAFLFTGQGSQYANMGRTLAECEPAVAAVFAEADRVMEPILGQPLTSYLFVDPRDAAAVERAEQALMQTAITQPAVLTMDTAVCRLLGEYAIAPDMVMGHSLGEYGALVAAGVLPFAHALEAAAARGREMTRVSLGDNGWLAAVMAPLSVVEETLAQIDGYVVPANINARGQCVIGGEGPAVARAIEAFGKQGYPAQRLPVSHAFHTRIVAPAAEPLRRVLDRLSISSPLRPLVANVTADFYPSGTEAIKDLLVRQIASPVQWVAGLEKLYASGVRAFVEVGPKRALKGFVDDVLGDRDGVVSLFTNRPQPKELAAFNQALCGLYAAGYGSQPETAAPEVVARPAALPPQPAPVLSASLDTLTQLLTQTIERLGSGPRAPYDRNQSPLGSIVISGTGLGLPGAEKPVMDPANAERILRGEQFVDLIPERFRALMAGKHVTRLVKGEDGSGHFETIEDANDVIKLAARPGPFDLSAEYGVPEKLVEALDITAQLAMAAGLDALREAGIPLVQTYRKTSTGKHLPERWLLPEALRDETGVIFASAFPGYDRMADEFHRYYTYEGRRSQRQALDDLRRHATEPRMQTEIQRRSAELDELLAREPYSFDRRFLLRVLTMGHSQFAEYIGARGPNAHVNAACASTPQAVAVAEDWIRSGRCRRVIVIGADNVTGAHLLEWIGAGFLATGAAATDAKVEDAALPFDRRRHGTLLGMGACALVLESQDAIEERGMRGIVELLATEIRNSAHHATRLDVHHIADVMDSLITSAERRFGVSRQAMAPETVFMSHETFTPARGGSAAAEVAALRRTFGVAASEIVVANTKGFTGHPMGVGIEDVIAVKILEHGIVPPVPNLREPDPELGELNLSRGGRYPVKYAIHLAAGFGSQIALTLTRRVPGGLDRADQKALHQKWLADVSGYDRAETEVVKRVLRVVAQGAPPRLPAASPWTYGIGPWRRATTPGDGSAHESRPAPWAPAAARPLTAAAPAALQPTPAMVAEAPALPSPTPPPAPGRDPVTAKVLAIVAEKTGYPPDMLDLDLDLEADLGVDTVKQAETFAAVREAYDIPRQENLRLREFPTLKHVVQFVFDHRPELAVATAPTAPTPPAAAPGRDPVTEKVLAIVAEKTGYPPDMLDLDLDLEADLGVDTVKQAETFAAVREAYDIPRQENLRLREFPTLKHVVQFVFDHRPELAVAATPTAKPVPTAVPSVPGRDPVTEKVLAIVAEKTGYPPDMLDLDLDLEADLGVDTVKQAETFAAVREAYDIPRGETLRLRDFPTLKHVVQFVFDHRPELAVATAPTATTAPAVAPAVLGHDPVTEKVLAIVAEKTGYPPDMLDLDLDLEADLGVDTVKQAETFAAVREAYDIPRGETLKLRDFPTLKHVVQFVFDHRPDLATVPPTASAAPSQGGPSAASPAPAAQFRAATIEDADRMPRRVPVPSLRPSLDLCKPTGVVLGGESRVVVMSDQGGVGEALSQRLLARGVGVLALDAGIEVADLEARLTAWMAEGKVQGVFWLPALDPEPSLGELDLPAFRELNRRRVKNLYAAMRALYEVAGVGSLLIAATRMGGLHGQGAEGATNPLGGAVAGFTKAYKREQLESLVKVVDFAPAAGSAEIAEALLAEALADPGVVEVGYQDGLRFTIGLEERPAADGRPGLSLGRDSVFVVTGAAGGITSAIVADLAAASGGSFYLLDLVPEPRRDDPKIGLLRADREQLKLALIAEMKARGERPTPVLIDRQILAVERAEAALRAVEAVETAGGKPHYRSVNLLDGPAVTAVVDEIRATHGRIDVLLHAGGIEISRKLSEKEPKEFDLVFDIKADGFFSLLRAAEGMPLGATVVFSSVAGRFGNSGQADYSAANALLCSLSSHLRRARPETKAIAIDWTAWGGIGMATRGSIPAAMQAAGIEMLPPESGVPTVRRELTVGGASGELVVAGRLGILGQEWDETGGLDPVKVNALLAARERPLLMIGSVTAAKLYGGLTVETTLDPKVQPFLFDHQIEGTPLLPGVMGTEAFAELASVLCPGYALAAIEDEEFLLPFKFFRMQKATLHLSATAQPDGAGDLLVNAVLRSVIRPKPELPAQERVHFRTRVRMSRGPQAPPLMAFEPPRMESLTVGADSLYRIYFHGPAYRVIERGGVTGETAISLMAAGLPQDAEPDSADSLTAPRLLELCLQTAGLWLLTTREVMALPAGLRRVAFYRQPELADTQRLYAVVTAVGQGDEFDARVVDEQGRVYLELSGYRTVSLPDRVALG